MQNFGQIENGSTFRIFGSVRALALKIGHRDYSRWIPRTQISKSAKNWPNPEWLHFCLVILRRFSCAVYGQIMILLCDLWLCRLWAHCAFYGWLCGLWLLLCVLWLTVRYMVTVRFMGCTCVSLYVYVYTRVGNWRLCLFVNFSVSSCMSVCNCVCLRLMQNFSQKYFWR